MQRDLFGCSGHEKLSIDSIKSRKELVDAYSHKNCLFIIGLSGGKDSVVAYLELCEMVPHEKIIPIHANLGVVEHDGVIEYIKSTLLPSHELVVVQNEQHDFIDMTLLRGMFPSPKYRTCTSSLKTGPIDKYIRKITKERNVKVAFNVTGLRSEESEARSLKSPLNKCTRLCTKTDKRTVYDFMPIFHYDEKMVYDKIYSSGFKPHPAYGYRGEYNDRLSCVFCIMGSVNDLRLGAEAYPDLYHMMIALEIVIGFTMFSKSKTKTVITQTGDLAIKSKVKETIKVPLYEKVGMPFIQSEVDRHIIELTERRERLLKLKEDSAATKVSLKTKKLSSSEEQLEIAI